jgi:hypothetical protein
VVAFKTAIDVAVGTNDTPAADDRDRQRESRSNIQPKDSSARIAATQPVCAVDVAIAALDQRWVDTVSSLTVNFIAEGVHNGK